jgi:transcriptional regulator with XRE-family HTH domain
MKRMTDHSKHPSMLRAVRSYQDLTLAELSEISGVDKQHICYVEKGRRPLTPRIAKRLATALNCPPRILMNGREREMIREINSDRRNADN